MFPNYTAQSRQDALALVLREDIGQGYKRLKNNRGQPCDKNRGWHGLKGACERVKKGGDLTGVQKRSAQNLAAKIKAEKRKAKTETGSPGWDDRLERLGALGRTSEKRRAEGDKWIDSIVERSKKGYKPEDSEWWASASYADRKVVSDQAEGWWSDLSKAERKAAIKSAGVTIKKVGIKGVNEAKVEDADSIFDFSGVQSDRMYQHFAKQKASGKIRSLDQMVNRKSGKSVAAGGAIASRNLSRERDTARVEQSAIGGSLKDYLINSGISKSQVEKVMGADFSVPYYPKDRVTGNTVAGAGLALKQIKRYLELNGGKLPSQFRGS